VNQLVAVRLLERMGCRVTVAPDGRVAVAAVSAREFDVVLMDLQMPEMDGTAATAAIRRAEERSDRHVPIIAMTAHAMQGDAERCLATGMDGYIAKPVRPLELAEALRERRGRDGAESAAELGEARAAGVRRVEDRDGVATFEDVRRAANVLGDRLVSLTPGHSTAPTLPRVPARAPRRWTSPGGMRSRRARSRGCPRDRRGCAPG
jgi:CheY-like chemotaxis protein